MNSGGGAIIAGVAELPDKSLASNGLTALQDKADLVNSIKKYLPQETLVLLCHKNIIPIDA